MGYGYGREDSEEDLVQWRKYCENREREKKAVLVNEVKKLISAIEKVQEGEFNSLSRDTTDAVIEIVKLKNSLKLLINKY
jgi:hypothetical protein